MALAIHTKERQVAESEERVRRIVQNALDAVVMMDAEGTIIDWNPQAEKTFGWLRNEALGKKVADLIIPPQLREAHTRGLANFQATGRGRILNQRIEFTAIRRDGDEFPVELAVTPYPIRASRTSSAPSFATSPNASCHRRESKQANASIARWSKPPTPGS